jgi:hypothetical protein
MVVHISPSKDDVGETICSLGFAKRARLIESCKGLSEVRKLNENCDHLGQNSYLTCNGFPFLDAGLEKAKAEATLGA